MPFSNATTAREVWQRVTAPPIPEAASLQNLLREAMETEAIYRRLPKQPLSQELLSRQKQTVAALRGICRLSGLSLRIQISGAPALPPDRCYRRAKTALAEYTARSIDPEFGPVFRALASWEEASCAALAQLLGQQ